MAEQEMVTGTEVKKGKMFDFVRSNRDKIEESRQSHSFSMGEGEPIIVGRRGGFEDDSGASISGGKPENDVNSQHVERFTRWMNQRMDGSSEEQRGWLKLIGSTIKTNQLQEIAAYDMDLHPLSQLGGYPAACHVFHGEDQLKSMLLDINREVFGLRSQNSPDREEKKANVLQEHSDLANQLSSLAGNLKPATEKAAMVAGERWSSILSELKKLEPEVAAELWEKYSPISDTSYQSIAALSDEELFQAIGLPLSPSGAESVDVESSVRSVDGSFEEGQDELPDKEKDPQVVMQQLKDEANHLYNSYDLPDDESEQGEDRHSRPVTALEALAYMLTAPEQRRKARREAYLRTKILNETNNLVSLRHQTAQQCGDIWGHPSLSTRLKELSDLKKSGHLTEYALGKKALKEEMEADAELYAGYKDLSRSYNEINSSVKDIVRLLERADGKTSGLSHYCRQLLDDNKEKIEILDDTLMEKLQEMIQDFMSLFKLKRDEQEPLSPGR